MFKDRHCTRIHHCFVKLLVLNLICKTNLAAFYLSKYNLCKEVIMRLLQLGRMEAVIGELKEEHLRFSAASTRVKHDHWKKEEGE